MVAIPNPLEYIGALIGELSLLFKFVVGVAVGAILVIIAVLANLAFGINIGQYVLEIVKFLFETAKAIWLWIITTFHYNNKYEVFALSIISLIMLVLIFMAFNVNQMWASGASSLGSGSIEIGSDAVRKASSGAGAGEGGGGYLPVSSTLGTEGTLPLPTVTATSVTTSTTLPDHCFNGFMDKDEEGVDCGGGCFPCHCFADNMTKSPAVCGSDCPNPCSCTPTGLTNTCPYGFCCPNTNEVSDICRNKCADSEGGDMITDYNAGMSNCNEGLCIQTPLNWIPTSGVTFGQNGLLDWY